MLSADSVPRQGFPEVVPVRHVTFSAHATPLAKTSVTTIVAIKSTVRLIWPPLFFPQPPLSCYYYDNDRKERRCQGREKDSTYRELAGCCFYSPNFLEEKFSETRLPASGIIGNYFPAPRVLRISSRIGAKY